jgi:hypothetical protein
MDYTGGKMNNVVRLFARKHTEIALSEPETHILEAVMRFLTSTGQLGQAVKKLSLEFDAMEIAIDTIDDIEARNRLTQSTKQSRETLSNAMLKLAQQMGKLVNRREVTVRVWHKTD